MDKFDELREKILPVLMPYGVKRVAIFGSLVRGEDTAKSDLDILVALKPPHERPPLGLFRWIALEEELSEKQQGKLEILRRYHRDMLKLDSVLEEMLEKLETLSREA